ncbi:MAG: ferrochelatase [Chlorobiaceae bacterium]|nr:ferrochelatase [Chlorobiaceae bacterium]
MAAKRIAVILGAHGEAETGGFVENYRVSLHTLQRASELIAVPVPLQHFISFSASLRKKITGKTAGSPQNPLTRRQSSELQKLLDQRSQAAFPELSFEVMAAFSASAPSVETALEKRHGYDGLIVVPMAPVDNALICGLLCRHLAETCSPAELARTRVIGRLWTDDALHRVCLDHLFGQADLPPATRKERNALMLLFHGTLVEDRNGAPPSFHTGQAETASFARRLTALIEADPRNPWGTVMTAYLNHDVGGRWSSPSFEEASRMVAAQGKRRLSLFAAGYFSDGNETVGRERYCSALEPEMRAETIPCLNDSPRFISFLADRVEAAARQILVFS